MREGWTLDELIKCVCTHCNVEQSDLRRRSRDNSASKAKALVCYLGSEKLGIKLIEIADRMEISRPAVSKWVLKGETISCVENWTDGFG